MSWETPMLSDADLQSLTEYITARDKDEADRESWYEFDAEVFGKMPSWRADWPQLSDSVGYPRYGVHAEFSPRDVFMSLEVYMPKRTFLELFLDWELAYHGIDN